MLLITIKVFYVIQYTLSLTFPQLLAHIYKNIFIAYMGQRYSNDD